MISLQDLWVRFRLAQARHNVDAALCFRHAIEAYNRCDYPSVLFWFREAEICEPERTQSLSEAATAASHVPSTASDHPTRAKG